MVIRVTLLCLQGSNSRQKNVVPKAFQHILSADKVFFFGLLLLLLLTFQCTQAAMVANKKKQCITIDCFGYT